MAAISIAPHPPISTHNSKLFISNQNPRSHSFFTTDRSKVLRYRPITVRSQVCTSKAETPVVVVVDKSALNVAEAVSEDELWATACLRVRSFYDFKPGTFGVQDHKRYLAEREFEALKERIAGKRLGFRRVSCINTTLLVSEISSFSNDLCTECRI